MDGSAVKWLPGNWRVLFKRPCGMPVTPRSQEGHLTLQGFHSMGSRFLKPQPGPPLNAGLSPCDSDCAGHFFSPNRTGPVLRPPILWRMLQRENRSSPESGLSPPLAPPKTDTADSCWVPSVPTWLAGVPQAGPGQEAMRAVAPPSRLHSCFSSRRELPIQGGLIQNHNLLHYKVEAAPRRVWR